MSFGCLDSLGSHWNSLNFASVRNFSYITEAREAEKQMRKKMLKHFIEHLLGEGSVFIGLACCH